jgi:hypothetical protein
MATATALLQAEPVESTVSGPLDLQQVVYQGIQSAARPSAESHKMPNLLSVDEGVIGDLPWFWQVGTNFNAKTYNWLNKLFAYDSDGYVGTKGSSLTTEYFNVLQQTAYVLDAADANALNSANLAAAAVAQTVITDWTSTMGPFPSGVSTLAAQLNYVISQVLTWGVPGLTLGQLRNSTNPMALLPNVPFGADQLVNDVMTYLAKTSSVANIQAAVVSFNSQIGAAKANTNPQPPVTSAKPGFMTIVNSDGTTAFVPQMTVQESIASIQNALVPTSGGNNFTASFTATTSDSSTVQISNSLGARGAGPIGDLLVFSASTGVKQTLFSFSSSVSSCTVEMVFNGVTTFTPGLLSYDISTGVGWWNPAPIEEAANPTPGQSGYQFSPQPAFDFGVNGNFGVISRLLISQQPVIRLTYTSSDFAALQRTFQSQTSWGVRFLGISLAGGSNSYFSSTTSQDASAGTITMTMSPSGITNPVAAPDQLAYVVGAQVLWPGASTLQNLAGI